MNIKYFSLTTLITAIFTIALHSLPTTEIINGNEYEVVGKYSHNYPRRVRIDGNCLDIFEIRDVEHLFNIFWNSRFYHNPALGGYLCICLGIADTPDPFLVTTFIKGCEKRFLSSRKIISKLSGVFYYVKDVETNFGYCVHPSWLEKENFYVSPEGKYISSELKKLSDIRLLELIENMQIDCTQMIYSQKNETFDSINFIQFCSKYNKPKSLNETIRIFRTKSLPTSSNPKALYLAISNNSLKCIEILIKNNIANLNIRSYYFEIKNLINKKNFKGLKATLKFLFTKKPHLKKYATEFREECENLISIDLKFHEEVELNNIIRYLSEINNNNN